MNSSVVEHYNNVKNQIPNIKLIAVSKRQPVESMQALIDSQISELAFGESYVQEYEEKSKSLKGDFEVHMIGQLQSNKAKKAVHLFDVIQSVSSVKLAKIINNEALKLNKRQAIFFQVNISSDQNKAGFNCAEIKNVYNDLKALPGLDTQGLMTITQNYDVKKEVRRDFQALKELASELDERLKLSMGMSSDYLIAAQEGADIVRVGTAIFGARV